MEKELIPYLDKHPFHLGVNDQQMGSQFATELSSFFHGHDNFAVTVAMVMRVHVVTRIPFAQRAHNRKPL